MTMWWGASGMRLVQGGDEKMGRVAVIDPEETLTLTPTLEPGQAVSRPGVPTAYCCGRAELARPKTAI